jgi:hypothetical protein
VQRLLDREHDLCLDRVDVSREVVGEVVLGQPGEAPGVDVEMRQGGTRRCLVEQGADRLALIESERGDVDQANDVGRVGAEGDDDLAAVGWPATTVGPCWRVSTRRSRATSSASVVIGNWGAVTRYPSACKCSMTALQLDPSAHAPCTRTMFGSALISTGSPMAMWPVGLAGGRDDGWVGGDVGPEVDPGLGLLVAEAGGGDPAGQLGPVAVAVHDGLVVGQLLAVPGLLG